MRALRLVAVSSLALGACYDPRLSDCTVRCSSKGDCGPGQTCGPQGYCAATAGACGAGSPDAPTDAPDVPDDGKKNADARPMRLAQLHLRVTKGGKIRVDSLGSCDSDGPQGGDCSFSVPEAVPLTLKANPRGGYRFEGWTTAACAGAAETCVLTPIDPLTEVAAQFVPDH